MIYQRRDAIPASVSGRHCFSSLRRESSDDDDDDDDDEGVEC